MIKQELRKKYLEIRNNLANKKEKDELILSKLLSNPTIKASSLILTYVSVGSEVDTLNLIKELIDLKKIAVPKVEGDVINFYFISSLNDLKKGKFGILEPTTEEKVKDFSNSCLLVPGICFNKKGYRIGYGKGYYDRFLSNYSNETIGLCYIECLIDDDFQEEHDIKVRKIVYK